MPRVLLLSVVLMACTTTQPTVTSPPVTVTTTIPPPPEAAEALESFVGCMEEAGFEVPGIRLDASGRLDLSAVADAVGDDPEGFHRAVDGCAGPVLMAGLLDLSTDPELQQVVTERLETYARCMRDLGLTTFPDPDPGFDGTRAPFPSDQVPTAHPAYQVIEAACRTVVVADRGLTDGAG